MSIRYPSYLAYRKHMKRVGRRTSTGTVIVIPNGDGGQVAMGIPSKTPLTAAQKARRSPKKRNWGLALMNQCRGLKLSLPVLEHHFHPERRFRFDCAWVERMVAVEIEGGIWVQGRHNRGEGFIADMHKYNEAVRLGWRLFRFSPSQVKNGSASYYLRKVLREDTEKAAPSRI